MDIQRMQLIYVRFINNDDVTLCSRNASRDGGMNKKYYLGLSESSLCRTRRVTSWTGSLFAIQWLTYSIFTPVNVSVSLPIDSIWHPVSTEHRCLWYVPEMIRMLDHEHVNTISFSHPLFQDITLYAWMRQRLWICCTGTVGSRIIYTLVFRWRQSYPHSIIYWSIRVIFLVFSLVRYVGLEKKKLSVSVRHGTPDSQPATSHETD